MCLGCLEYISFSNGVGNSNTSVVYGCVLSYGILLVDPYLFQFVRQYNSEHLIIAF